MMEPTDVLQATPEVQAAPAATPAPTEGVLWATGRRKEAIARVQLVAPGSGKMTINHQPCDRYFPREALQFAVRQPLLVAQRTGTCDIRASVEGGGLTGQAGAVRLGISRALLLWDPALRAPLRGAGFLTRDPRARERKKYGQKGARKRFQWTKR
jgi:small subunit ribosomal protein S9